MEELEAFERRIYRTDREVTQFVCEHVEVDGRSYSVVYEETGDRWQVGLGRPYPTNSEVAVSDTSYYAEELPGDKRELQRTVSRIENENPSINEILEPVAAD